VKHPEPRYIICISFNLAVWLCINERHDLFIIIIIHTIFLSRKSFIPSVAYRWIVNTPLKREPSPLFFGQKNGMSTIFQ